MAEAADSNGACPDGRRPVFGDVYEMGECIKPAMIAAFVAAMLCMTGCGSAALEETRRNLDALVVSAAEPAGDAGAEEAGPAGGVFATAASGGARYGLAASGESARPFSGDAASYAPDLVGDAVGGILAKAGRDFLGGYPVDESFLLWFMGSYGREALDLVASEAAGGQDVGAWFRASGSSIHVLWLEYCREHGMHSESLERVTFQECASPGQTVISFTGDLNFDDRTGTMQLLKSGGLDAAIDPKLQSLLAGSDILMANCECTFSDRGSPLPGKAYTFRSAPENASILGELGVDIAGIANNHVYDYGPDALVDTIDTLDAAGIPNVGAGKNIEGAMRPWYFVANGRKIAFTAATQVERSYNYTKEATETEPGVLKTLDPARYAEVISEAKAHSDIVVAFVHWGTEGASRFEGDQERLAEAFADAGADVIIGGHTHCLQGASFIGDVPVIYSLGNFWFGSTPTDGVRRKDTGIAQAVIGEDGGISLRFVPCVQENRRTRLVTDEAERGQILSSLESVSEGAEIGEDGYITKK